MLWCHIEELTSKPNVIKLPYFLLVLALKLDLWFIFSMWFKVGVQLHFFACGYPLFPTLFAEKSFHYWMVLAFLSKIIWGHDLFLHSLFYSIGLHVCFYTSTTISLLTLLCSKFWISKCSPPTLFFFKSVFGTQSPLRFQTNFRMGFSISARYVIGIFTGFFALNPDYFG